MFRLFVEYYVSQCLFVLYCVTTMYLFDSTMLKTFIYRKAGLCIARAQPNDHPQTENSDRHCEYEGPSGKSCANCEVR